MCLDKKTVNKTRIKVYNTLALPTLLHDSENWTIKARDATRVTATEMKYRRRTAGHTGTDDKTNTDIAKELNITPVLDNLQDCKTKWVQHVSRMPRKGLIKKLHPRWQKEPRKTIEEISGCVRPQLVNKWPNSLIAT
jgi:hypothetical protein